MTESRQAQYLRILENNGPDDTQSDRQACKYLKEMGYADCHLRESKQRDNYGEVEKVEWIAVTSKGLDFIDEMRSQLEQSKQKPTDRPTHHDSQDIRPTVQSVMSQVPPVEQKLWYERSTLRAFVFLLGVAVVAAAFAKWLGLAG